MKDLRRIAALTLIVGAGAGVVGCGSSSSSSSNSGSSNSGSSSSGSSGSSSSGSSGSSSSSSGNSGTSVSASSFTNDYSAMSQLKPLAAKGKGKVAAILPDTTSSTRYVQFDQPGLQKALSLAGLPSSDIIVQNAQKSDSTFLTDAESDITNGATVLLIDPEDSGVGLQVETYAKSHGVQVINYDRLVTGGPADDYVSFDNVHVGELIGKGFQSCVSAWHVSHPNVIVMRGDPTDNNAGLFYQGYYDNVLKADISSGKYTVTATPAGTWDPPTALTEFEQAYTAHSNSNSAVIPNDENAAPIITYLKSHGVKANSFPTTGQDASIAGLQNILGGYQCGTVYKPIYLEVQAAVALAMYLRAGQTPPSSLLNGSVTDPKNGMKVPSVLESPEWVTTANMKDTIVKDQFVPTSQLCGGNYAAECKKYGIS